MHAAIWLPCFHLQAALRLETIPNKRAVALLDVDGVTGKDQAVLREVNAVAERYGVFAGMTAPQAQARCPKIYLLHPAPEEEELARRQLLECAAGFTPNYEHTLPGLCVLDLSRMRNLAGQEMQQARRMLKQLSHHQLDARLGFAAHADLAMLAAQAAQPVLILKAEEDATSFLHALPLSALRPSEQISQILTLWGIRTVGDFVHLARADVASRLGAEGTLLWEMASGSRERLLQLVRLPARFRSSLELEHAIECLEPLLFLLRRMLDQLCLRLQNTWMVAAAMRLVMRFADQSEHRTELRVAEPSRDVELLFRILHTHLEGLQAAAPIIYLSLQLQPTRPGRSQGDLFSRGVRDPNRFAETLAQIEALLGSGNVGKVRLLPSRRLDAFTLDNYLQPVTPLIQSEEAETWPEHGLLLRRFRPSPEVRVFLEDERPSAIQTSQNTLMVTQASGPWLLSGEWWDEAAWQREIWEVAANDGSLYQLAREADRWVIDGVYG